MTAFEPESTACVADVAEQLMTEFAGTVTVSRISHVVLRAREDLRQHVLVDDAFPYLLADLARVRLSNLHAARRVDA